MIEFIIISGLGALAQEVAHWHELRKKFAKKRVKALLRSREYWLITLAMIVLSPFCCWALFGQDEIGRQFQFISGAAFPLLLKKIVSAFSEFDATKLGASSVSDYFQLYSFGGK